jgi:O-antigen ligase
MSWLVDNATNICLLLVVVAAGFVVAWRFNQRVKCLVIAAGLLAFAALFWIATRYITTDAKQLEDNVHAMARAVEAGKVDDLFKHISKDFDYHKMTRDELYKLARKAIESHKVNGISVRQFKVLEVSRSAKKARASFTVSGMAADVQFIYRVETDFVLEGDEWKLKTMRFYNPAVNQTEEIRLPGI